MSSDRLLTIAANNGDVGGGEVMLLALATEAAELGCAVTVIGPEHPGGVVDQAEAAGHSVVRLAQDRRTYLRELRTWDRTHRRGLLWCNGLVPAFATTGRDNRVVHLHQIPTGAHKVAARLAARGAFGPFVPSHAMSRRIPGSRVLWNWSERVEAASRERSGSVVGFLGRPSVDKGVLVLAAALAAIRDRVPGTSIRLLLAGEPRFVPARDRAAVDAALAPVRDMVDEVGWLGRADFFGSIDVAVFPSVVAESFGLVVTEAMSCRTPFVVSDAGALPEVAGSDHPWVVPAGDAEALAEAILDCLGRTPENLAPVLDAAQDRWRNYFSPAAGRDRLAAILTELGVLS